MSTRAENPDGYVYEMLVNTFRTSRRRRSWQEAPTGPSSVEHAGDPSDTDRALLVRLALQRLTAEQREVVVARYPLELGELQAAHVLGIPPGTVKSRLARGLADLARDTDLHMLRPGG